VHSEAIIKICTITPASLQYCKNSPPSYWLQKNKTNRPRGEKTTMNGNRPMNLGTASEVELKAALLSEFLRRGRIGRESVLANEYSLSLRSNRADLAILDSHFFAVEVKSNRDTMRRLGPQLSAYQEHFDLTVLLVGSKHLAHAMAIEGPSIELWVADKSELRLVRESKQIGITRQDTGIARGFRGKFTTTSAEFWAGINGETIAPSDIRRLSRFAERRDHYARATEYRQSAWERLSDFLVNQSFHSSSVS
jgi:hypothetical protein